MKSARHDQLQIFCVHFIGLISADRGLKGKQMLMFDAIGFCQYLPPTVFAGGLYAQHSQLKRIMLGRDTAYYFLIMILQIEVIQ